MRAWLKRLTVRHWTWLHFKAAVLIWVVTLGAFTPKQVDGAIGSLVGALMWVTVAGCLISASGLVMSAQRGKVAVIGLSIEFVGIWFTFAGPVSYLITQIYLSVTLPDGDQRYALAWLAYTLVAGIICRISIVGPRRSKEAHDPQKRG